MLAYCVWIIFCIIAWIIFRIIDLIIFRVIAWITLVFAWIKHLKISIFHIIAWIKHSSLPGLNS
jgi:hypothetical protein